MTLLVLEAPDLTWAELSATFNREPFLISSDLVERLWCKYILVTATGIYYLPHKPELESHNTVWVDVSRWSEVVLLTDKLTKEQLIEYFSN